MECRQVAGRLEAEGLLGLDLAVGVAKAELAAAGARSVDGFGGGLEQGLLQLRVQGRIPGLEVEGTGALLQRLDHLLLPPLGVAKSLELPRDQARAAVREGD